MAGLGPSHVSFYLILEQVPDRDHGSPLIDEELGEKVKYNGLLATEQELEGVDLNSGFQDLEGSSLHLPGLQQHTVHFWSLCLLM